MTWRGDVRAFGVVSWLEGLVGVVWYLDVVVASYMAGSR